MKRATALIVLLVCLSFARLAGAAEHFASPTGSSGANGTISSPWDLQTALNQPTSVVAGDTIWLRAGTYVSPTSDGFVSNLNGTASSPIIVRNYAGERATLDAHNRQAGLSIAGSYAWFWGLEIIDSTTQRVSFTTAATNAIGVGVYGPGIKCINMIVHDTLEGFSAYNAAPNSEFYGNLSYYNGFVGTDRNHGHGMYFQNDTGVKIISDNFVGDNADEGIQIYGSGSAALNGFTITGNGLYNTSSWPNPHYQYNLIIAGGLTRQNIQVLNNYSYFPASAAQGNVNLGQYTPGQDMTIENNVFAGGFQPVTVSEQSGPVLFTNNILYASSNALRLLSLVLFSGQNLSNYRWETNTYYDMSPYHFYFGTTPDGNSTSGVNGALPMWKSETGFDAHSTYNPSGPTGVWTYVRPNKYESKRANVSIYNWDLQPTVFVDLSSVLSPGDQYIIRDAQNFYGNPVETGTYSGNPVGIAMSGLTKASPIGFAAPAHTGPVFGTFVVLPANTAASAPPQQIDTTPPSVTISAPANGLTVSGTVTILASASDNVGVSGLQFSIDGANFGPRISAAPYTATWDSTTASTASHTITATAFDAAGNSSSSNVTITVNNAGQSTAPGQGNSAPAGAGSASFVGTDATTQGNWKSVYGIDGNAIPDTTPWFVPSYATFAPENQGNYTWTSNGTEVRDLQVAWSSTTNVRQASCWYTYFGKSFDLNINFTDGKSHRLSLYFLDYDNGGRVETVQVLDAATGTVLDNKTVANFYNGLYLIWNLTGHVKIVVTVVSGTNAGISGAFFDPMSGSTVPGSGSPVIGSSGSGSQSAGPPSGTASFSSSDTSTAGNWRTVYGQDGYSIPNSTQAVPAYATFAVQNGTPYSWIGSTSDTRAPQTGNGSGRLASTWFSSPTLSFDLNFIDGNSHELALYALDWDSKGRAETIRILDANTAAVLDTRSITNFSNGIYLSWNLTGHVKITITATSGPNAVLSGAFWGSGNVTGLGNAAKFLRTDATTQGSWKGVYGLDGYAIANVTPNSIPGYAALTPQNQGNWLWTSSGTDPRELQTGSSAGNPRQATSWFTYYGNTFDLDLSFSDGQAHPFELYLLDWDGQGRSEVIQIVDAVSNTVLDTQSVSNFTQGIYYIWQISGHVKINVTRSGGVNAVVSGAFFN